MLSPRARHLQFRTAAEALAFIGLPAAILDKDRRSLARNGLLEDFADQIKWLPHGKLALLDPQANELLGQALEALAEDASPSVRAFPARSCQGKTVIVHVLPAPGLSRDLFDSGIAIVAFTLVQKNAAPDASLIRALYDLSAGEARIARGLTKGQTVDEIAASAGVSPETVRSQVKAVLAKTGTRRQAEATALLAGLAHLPFKPTT